MWIRSRLDVLVVLGEIAQVLAQRLAFCFVVTIYLSCADPVSELGMPVFIAITVPIVSHALCDDVDPVFSYTLRDKDVGTMIAGVEDHDMHVQPT